MLAADDSEEDLAVIRDELERRYDDDRGRRARP